MSPKDAGQDEPSSDASATGPTMTAPPTATEPEQLVDVIADLAALLRRRQRAVRRLLRRRRAKDRQAADQLDVQSELGTAFRLLARHALRLQEQLVQLGMSPAAAERL